MENRSGWFGESWGAPICVKDDHIHTPIGESCTFCEEVFVNGDQGITNLQGYSWHADCYMRIILGGMNHIRGICSCCGGTAEPDPENVSKREAARLAVLEWEKMKNVSRTRKIPCSHGRNG